MLFRSRIVEKTPRSGSIVFGFAIDPEIDRYVVAKGSVTVDGVSLTVNCCDKNRFYVNVIPHTAAGTTLASKQPSATVNIETDILARHVEKLLFAGRDGAAESEAGAGGIDLDLLARHGFLK